MEPPKSPPWNVYDPRCPSRTVLDLIGGRWTVLLIGALAEDPRRFGELQRQLGGISAKVLTQVLRALVRDGLATRTLYPEVPPRTEYRLTELGEALIPPLAALRDWAEVNIETILESRGVHDELGGSADRADGSVAGTARSPGRQGAQSQL
ncbi:MAG TPA: helix-turn-helix domain-containing protein [Candidatus Limnocylindrales bacterium]